MTFAYLTMEDAQLEQVVSPTRPSRLHIETVDVHRAQLELVLDRTDVRQ